MTNEQLGQLIAALRPQEEAGGARGGQVQSAGAAAVVGPMMPCPLGKDKLKRFKKWNDWIRDAENKMAFLGLTSNQQRISFIKSCAGSELTEFWLKEARIRFEARAANAEAGIEAQEAHTYKEMVEETNKTLLKLVSRDRAIIDLLRMEQGNRSFMEFLSEVEDQEHLCRTEEKRITSDDLKRISLIAGIKDRTLAEKALAEEYSLRQVIQAAANRENSKANVEAMQPRGVHHVNRLEEGEEPLGGGELDARLNFLQAELEDVMRIRKNGKYSGRYKSATAEEKDPCHKCTYQHGENSSCPAEGRRCNECGKLGHFSRSTLCKSKKKSAATRRVKEEEKPSESEDSSTEEEAVQRIGEVPHERQWPGVRRKAKSSHSVHHVARVTEKFERKGKSSRWVNIRMGGTEVKLYCDTGSKLTIIPPELYKPSMGKVVAAKCHLRAWGSSTYLDTKGMFKTVLQTVSGAWKRSWVYVVAGARPEPLLGDEDAEDLGVVTFHPEGRRDITTYPSLPSVTREGVSSAGRATSTGAFSKQTFSPSPLTTDTHVRVGDEPGQNISRSSNLRNAGRDTTTCPSLPSVTREGVSSAGRGTHTGAFSNRTISPSPLTTDTHVRPGDEPVQNISIPSKLRKAGIEVTTERPRPERISKQGKEEALAIVKEYMGPVFSDKIGNMKVPPVQLQYEPGFRPTQPAHYPVPYHYQDRLGVHLKKLTKEDIIEDVHPAEPVDCILNLAISEKKTQGSIRMNIDARPYNKGAKHTKYHVPTPQEVRHQLEGATVFSELDMGNGFHQVPLSSKSHIIFQSHLGLHRMKRLFFGPTNSSGIFHHEVSKAFAGVPGCITIHDNLLVFGRNVKEHNANLRGMLERAKKLGVTLKLSKSTVCEPEVKWFGRVYSGAGVSADPEKIKHIVQAGRPESIEEVRSLLQAAAYNAKYAFDHKEDCSYEEATAPLRELLVKDAKFDWNERREQSFQKLLRMLNDKTYLAPYNPKRKTHFVSDASPVGISASLYQEDDKSRWVPVDHVSRALSAHERNWDSQIDWESLGKMWGMMMFRHYLIGVNFTSWGDHQPLLPFYNDLSKAAPVRIAKHRTRILDLKFTDKYIPGKEMPCDYASRHPMPIEGLPMEEKERLLIDEGDDIQVMRVMMADLPPALTLEMVQEAARRDPVYQELARAVQKGRKPKDPEFVPYTSVWKELAVVEGVLCFGERMIIPDSTLPGHEVNLRDWVVDLGHSAHQGVDATKRQLRLRLWFPGMDKAVERAVSRCLPCQASVESHHRDPLHPTTAPEEPWSCLYTDHWGPTQEGNHILVIIDGLTRYPEVVVVKGTSAEDNIHAFSEVFSRHGLPKRLRSDNGPPFNGKDSHLLQRYFKHLGIDHCTNRSAEDPEASGQVEAFMKHLKKIFHTAAVAKEDPYLKINDYLMQYRATPHPTTKKSPAELLFNRKFITRLPDLRRNPALGREDIKEAREEDRKEKEKMKAQKDKGQGVREHKIEKGDMVLLKRKSTKQDSVYDPQPYCVTETYGTQIAAVRGDQRKTRDAQRWKKVEVTKKRCYETKGAASRYQEDPDIGAGMMMMQGSEVEQVQRGGEDEVVHEERLDIMARLRRRPEVILAETVANRPQRQRKQTEVYQAPGRLRGRK